MTSRNKKKDINSFIVIQEISTNLITGQGRVIWVWGFPENFSSWEHMIMNVWRKTQWRYVEILSFKVSSL